MFKTTMTTTLPVNFYNSVPGTRCAFIFLSSQNKDADLPFLEQGKGASSAQRAKQFAVQLYR